MRVLLVVGLCVLGSGCVSKFSIGGSVDGYEPTLGALSLSLNGGAPLVIAANGAFTFPTAVEEQKPWAVALVESPSEQSCALEGADGTVGRAAIDTVRVTCVTRRYVLGGQARGVDRAGLVLHERGTGQRLALEADAGSFFFPAPLPFASAYDVAVEALPVGRDCGLDGGSGAVRGAVTSLDVQCAPSRFPLTVTLVGVDAGGLTLTEQATSQSAAPAAGDPSVTFAATLPWETSWEVRITATPEGRDCALDGGAGVVLGPISAPQVTCNRQRFTVGGAVVGLDAGSLQLLEATTQQTVTVPAGASSFALPTTVEWDTALALQVAAQPATKFCAVDGGVRVVRAAVTDVLVSCRNGWPVTGQAVNLRGDGLVLAERGTSQALPLSPDGGLVDFALAALVPEGDPLRLEVATHPTGQTCRVDAPAGAVTGPTAVRVVCGPRLGHLAINEVGSVPNRGTPFWVELYNGMTQPAALLDYQLRSASLITTDGGVGPVADFQLPDASIPPGGYLVLSSKPYADLHDSAQQRFLVQTGALSLTPFPGATLELRTAGVVADGVVFDGGSLTTGWTGPGLTLPDTAMDLGRSLARTQVPETDTAADFATCDFPTPGGLNDVCTSTDADADGLPDVAEVAHATFAELPLFAWGARTAQRDVFVEVDWLDPTGFNGTFDPGVQPRREALERVAQVYAAHGVSLHFDTGALFHPAPGPSPADFDLGGGNQAPWACTLTLNNVSGAVSFYLLKAAHADLRRRFSFHYLVFASALSDVACPNSGQGVTGNAELGGNDFIVALGRSGLSTGTTANLNRTINWQSATLMHELGHNLGLRHGGFEDANYKPNYLSVMNYFYQFDGLPVLGSTEGDRYFREYVLYGVCSGAPGITSVNGLNRNRFSTPAQYGLDYSDGSSVDLNEAALNEAVGFGRTGSGSVDWNWNTTIDTGTVTANVNGLTNNPYVCPRASSGNEVLRDHDDWGALKLPFSRTQRGSASGAPRRAPRRTGLAADFMGDHQPVAQETPLRRE